MRGVAHLSKFSLFLAFDSDVLRLEALYYLEVFSSIKLYVFKNFNLHKQGYTSKAHRVKNFYTNIYAKWKGIKQLQNYKKIPAALQH